MKKLSLQYQQDLNRKDLQENWYQKLAMKTYAKRLVMQQIHQKIKDNVLERNQNRKFEEIKNALLSRENQNTLNQHY